MQKKTNFKNNLNNKLIINSKNKISKTLHQAELPNPQGTKTILPHVACTEYTSWVEKAYEMETFM